MNENGNRKLSIAITGYSGFIGQRLIAYFQRQNANILTISRKDLENREVLRDIIQEADIIINLAGATINKAWTSKYKEEILNSRINTTRKIVEAINDLNDKSKHLISASAVGIYTPDMLHNENSRNYANNFLGLVCQKWEDEANEANCNVAIARLGVVIDLDGGGFIQTVKPIFNLGLGAVLGNGKQIMSWIHIEDLTKAFHFIIEHQITGVVNLVAPENTTNEEFSKAFSKYLKRPLIFKISKFILQILFGEKHIIMTEGANVIPLILKQKNFRFKYPSINKVMSLE